MLWPDAMEAPVATKIITLMIANATEARLSGSNSMANFLLAKPRSSNTLPTVSARSMALRVNGTKIGMKPRAFSNQPLIN